MLYNKHSQMVKFKEEVKYSSSFKKDYSIEGKINGIEMSINILHEKSTQLFKKYKLNSLMFQEGTSFTFVRFIVKHYTNNYYTVGYVSINNEDFYKIKSELENVLKDLIWGEYINLLISQKVIPNKTYAPRSEMEKQIKEWEIDGEVDLWCEQNGTFETCLICYEPELKARQQELWKWQQSENERHNKKMNEEINLHIDFTGLETIKIKMQGKDFKRFYNKIVEKYENNKLMVINGRLKSLRNFQTLTVFSNSQKTNINEYL